MRYHGIDLKNATIHDFTTDKRILVNQFGIEQSKEDYNKGLSVQTRIKDLLDYADLKNDKELERAIHKTFESELETFGYE